MTLPSDNNSDNEYVKIDKPLSKFKLFRKFRSHFPMWLMEKFESKDNLLELANGNLLLFGQLLYT